MTKRIILPLDNLNWKDASVIIQKTSEYVWGYKIRKVILQNGLKVIEEIKHLSHGQANIMVDFKLYDIPMAITECLMDHIAFGADISTVHCTASYEPHPDIPPDKIVGVTILTSMRGEDFQKYYRGPGIIDTVKQMVKDAEKFQYGYIVCSPLELEFLKDFKIKKICPGIRPEWYTKDDDQIRVSTPAGATADGADLLVIGRPILEAHDMVEAIWKTHEEIMSV